MNIAITIIVQKEYKQVLINLSCMRDIKSVIQNIIYMQLLAIFWIIDFMSLAVCMFSGHKFTSLYRKL